MHKNAVTMVRYGALGLIGLFILIYSGFQAEKLVRGPILEVFTPQTGATYNQTLIELEGRSRNTAFLYLNGKQIFTDKNGYFKEKLLLLPGYNIIKIDAEDKFRQHEEKVLEVVLKEY